MALSDEERRARNAAKNRAYRARKAAEREAAAAAAAGHVSHVDAPSTMRDAVEATITAAKWLTGADAASIAQARIVAKRIDVLEHGDETTRALSAHRALSQIMNDLGATATKRQQYELRSRKASPESEGSDDSDAPAIPEGGNVTKLRRPPKRRA